MFVCNKGMMFGECSGFTLLKLTVSLLSERIVGKKAGVQKIHTA